MATQSQTKRDKPSHSRRRIQELARQEAVQYASRSVQKDVQNLGYSFEEVCECIAELRPGDFRDSTKYENSPNWLDAYTMPNVHDASGWTDDLYIKLALSGDCLWVSLHSFHREGAL
jgi:hypothetical protein